MTDFVSEIEQELIDASNFKPERNYRDRQMYLGALLRACIHDLDDDQFDALSDPAAEWCNAAAEANRDGHPLPEFEGGNGHENGASAPVVHETKDISNRAASPHVEPELQSGANGLEAEVPHVQPKKEKKNKGGRPKKVKVTIAVEKPKEKKPRKNGPGIQEHIALKAVRGVNQWGITLGTKADIACRMAAQEGGCTMKDIKEATGDTRYNLFNQLKRRQQPVTFENGRIYLGKAEMPPPNEPQPGGVEAE